MTVKGLIEILKTFDPDQEVYFAHTSGDYWGTVLASEITGMDIGEVIHSHYHQQKKVVTQEEFNHICDEEEVEVLDQMQKVVIME